MSMKNSMRVKVLVKFRNPLTGRLTKVGEFLNVAQGIFWLKRIKAKDCEKVAMPKKIKKAVVIDTSKSASVLANKEPKKGSK